MRRLALTTLTAAVLLVFGFDTGEAQEVSDFLSVGEMAPDIEVVGATRHGLLAQPVNLSDLRGETVVLAFFFNVRTGG